MLITADWVLPVARPPIRNGAVLVDGGVIVEEGTPSEVFDHPKHERTKDFLGHIA